MTAVNYEKIETPEDYKCSSCGAAGCKLWREYETFSPKLLCAKCAAVSEGKDITSLRDDGMRDTDLGRTDQIGWYVPAVPDPDGVGYWGYLSVPDDGVLWWKSLPTFCADVEQH